MRLSRIAFVLPLLAPLALSLPACDDSTGIGKQVIVTDTLTIGVPSVAAAGVPTALDVISPDQVTIGGSAGGGRFPERPAEAEQWDVTLRLRDGAFQLQPRGAVGVDARRVGITSAIQGVTFEGLDKAPPSSRFSMNTGVTLAVGSVYVVRSRTYSLSGITCWQFSKVQPLALDPAAGTARLAVATSASCQDERLAPGR